MSDYLEISLRLLVALVFGGLVGLERSYHGRPAGFRTHTLVCLASAVLMLVTVYEGQWFATRGMERVRTQNSDRLRQLSEALIHIPTVLEFRISPTGD